MDVYISRHGQTEWNTEFRMQGLCDSPLTETGISGAASLGKELSALPEKISVCYVSPMPRAVKTAEIAIANAGYDIPVIVDPDLREMDLGSWEGMPRDEAAAKYPENFYFFRHDPDRYVPVNGGEYYTDVLARARRVLDRLSALTDDEGPVLIISHMILVQSLLFAYNRGEWSGLMNLRAIGDIAQTTLYKITL